mmetsp:Transcript_46028/g.55403  ORF Transcript_46028/g.55403 Transcript_46028/m.55403 type:complete len:120 (+) Transcript_46028:206-565(+)
MSLMIRLSHPKATLPDLSKAKKTPFTKQPFGGPAHQSPPLLLTQNTRPTLHQLGNTTIPTLLLQHERKIGPEQQSIGPKLLQQRIESLSLNQFVRERISGAPCDPERCRDLHVDLWVFR